MNPSVSVGKAPTQPPPVPEYKDKWVKRVYQALKNAATPSGSVDFGVTNFGLPSDAVVFVDKVQVWNLTPAAKGLEATFPQGNSTDLGTDNVVAQDFSSLGQCPGVTFKVPLGHAKGVSGTTVVVSAKNAFTSTDNPQMVAHLTCWVAV